jgi:hypothetical protein
MKAAIFELDGETTAICSTGFRRSVSLWVLAFWSASSFVEGIPSETIDAGRSCKPEPAATAVMVFLCGPLFFAP